MSDLDAYRHEMRAWLAAHLPRRRVGAPTRSGRDLSAEEVAALRRAQREVYQAGYLGIDVPVEYGGQGLTAAHRRVWAEESADYEVPMPGGVASRVTLGVIVPTILAHADEGQKRAWVPRILSGEEIWAQLLSEPGAGSDLAGLLTRATPDGDGWVLHGTKVWSSGARFADFGICLARTDWDAPKHRGLTWFKVPLRDERVTVRPIREINGSSEFCEEFLDDVFVGADMVIGPVNGGWPIANAMLAIERTTGADQARPSGTRALAPDLVLLAQRRGTTADAAVRQLIARAHTEDFVQQAMSRRVLTAVRLGVADPASPSLLKLGQGIVQPERAAAAMEIAGRAGIAWADEEGGDTAMNYLNGRIMAIAGGSNQIQRNIISERLLGLPREAGADEDRETPFSRRRR
jgi:alkylation response protein AidB-like acyl-CoA dehydrogenase